MTILGSPPHVVKLMDPHHLSHEEAAAFARDFRARELLRHQRTVAINKAADELDEALTRLEADGCDPRVNVRGLADLIVTAYEDAIREQRQ